MVRVPGDDTLEGLHDLLGARLSRALRRPEVPGPQVHHGIGEEGRGLQVVGKLARGLAHRVGVGAVERLALGLGIGRVALADGLDHRALHRARAGRERLGLLHGGQRPRLALGVGRVVVVAALGHDDAPVAHGASRIEARGFLERPLRLVVVEPVHQPQALIEPPLGVGRGRGDPVGVASEGIVEDRTSIGRMALMVSLRLTLHGGVLTLHRAAGHDEQNGGQDDRSLQSHVRSSRSFGFHRRGRRAVRPPA